MRRTSNLTEEKIIMHAIYETNVSKFVSLDIPIFNGIMTDLFPNMEIMKNN
jgi:hypothetical protein